MLPCPHFFLQFLSLQSFCIFLITNSRIKLKKSVDSVYHCLKSVSTRKSFDNSEHGLNDDRYNNFDTNNNSHRTTWHCFIHMVSHE